MCLSSTSFSYWQGKVKGLFARTAFLEKGREKEDWFRSVDNFLCSAVSALRSLHLKSLNDECPPLALEIPVTQVTGSDMVVYPGCHRYPQDITSDLGRPGVASAPHHWRRRGPGNALTSRSRDMRWPSPVSAADALGRCWQLTGSCPQAGGKAARD